MNKRSKAPPDVLEAAAFREREARRRGIVPRTLEKLRGGDFQHRHFAGPLRWAMGDEQISPLRVAHLTDLHLGRVTPMAAQREAISRVNAEAPDLVALTGDFVCHSQEYLDALEEVLAGIEAPAVAVLGNHDYWAGGDEVIRALERSGVLVLRNQNTILRLGSERLQVVGLDDAYTGHADLHDATRGLRDDLPTLALSHIGEEADALWAKGAGLVLAGHTHAGQVTLAGLHELAVGKVAGHRYVHGLYGCRRAGTEEARGAEGALYVGAGVGAAVMPLRLGDRAKREVATFDLGHAPGDFDEHHDDQRALPGRSPSARTQSRRQRAVERKRGRREAKAEKAAKRNGRGGRDGREGSTRGRDSISPRGR